MFNQIEQFSRVAYNITDVPADLMEHLGLPNEFVAQIMILLICVFVFSVPFIWRGYNSMGIVMAVFSVIFCTAMGWVDAWIIMLITMLSAGMFAFGFFRKTVNVEE